MSGRYGGKRIRRGLKNFILGKGVSAIAGMLAMLLVIRELSVESFAAYSVLVALVEIMTALSGLGLAHALLRYVPELYSRHYQVSLQKFVYGVFSLRTGVLLLAAMLAYVFADELAQRIGLGTVIFAYKVFLLVVVLRSTTHFLSQILESSLHQGIAQTGFTIATLVRLAGMVYLLQKGDVQLIDVIWVEVIGDALSFQILFFGVIWVVGSKSAEDKCSKDDGSWLRQHFRKIAKFALAGYLQHLAIMPAGGHTNRLLGGGMLNVGAMAAYGFAQSLYEYVKRYMPAQLLAGLIRPIVVARYCEHGDFTVAAGLCGRVLQINILLIVGIFAMVMVGGGEAMSAISAGKYSSEALPILAVLFLVLLLETQRQQIELLVQAVERYQYLIPSNMLLSSSVLLAIFLIPLFGAVAFPAANAIGLIVANAWVLQQMKAADFHFRHDWLATTRVIVLCAFAVMLGVIAKLIGLPWYLAITITLIIYSLLGYVVCGEMVKSFVRDLTGEGARKMPKLAENQPVAPLKIAFGVLSSKKSVDAINEIATAVFPHPVYVHHDFSKQPDFSPNITNIHVIQQPVNTSWGDWSLVEASLLLMNEAMEDLDVTHFQLLSEACLPVRPIREFEAYLSRECPDVMIDILPLENKEAMFSHGWRYFPRSYWTKRLLHLITSCSNKNVKYRAICSVNLRMTDDQRSIRTRVGCYVGRIILRVFAKSAQNMLSESGLKQFAIGGQWFGASRRAVMWLLCARNEYLAFTRHYQHSPIPDESYFHTLVYNAQIAGLPLRIYPSNHSIFWDGCGMGPDMLSEQDADRILSSGKFFSRKFSLMTHDALRQHVLSHIRASKSRF